MNELKFALKSLDIKCMMCLDTKKLWSRRHDYFDPLDEFKNYDMYNCHECSNGSFIKYNPTNNIYPILCRNDNNINTRINILKPILSFIEDKKNEIENILNPKLEWIYKINKTHFKVLIKNFFLFLI